MDAYRVISLIVAILLIAGIALMLESKTGGRPESTGTTPMEATGTTTVSSHESTETVTKTTSILKTTTVTITATSTITTHPHTTTRTSEAGSGAETTTTRTSTKTSGGITPVPGAGKPQGANAVSIMLKANIKGNKGWIELEQITVSYSNKSGELNISMKLTLPDPCWKLKYSGKANNTIYKIELDASRNPRDICVMMLKQDTITIHDRVKAMPNTILVKVIVNGKVTMLKINLETKQYMIQEGK